MSRRGFALLAVLWMLALLTAALAATSTALNTEVRASRNRVLAARARWAAEACAAIATDHTLNDRIAAPDTVDLGRGTRCTWVRDDPARRLDVNHADRDMLERFLVAYGLTDSVAMDVVNRLVRQRAGHPLASETQLLALGIPRAAAVQTTPDQTEGISSDAPLAVLEAAGLSEPAAHLLESRQREGRPVMSLAELQELVAPGSLGHDYQALARVVQFVPTQQLLLAQGWVADTEGSPSASMELLVRRRDGRLAVLRQRQW